MVDRTKTLDELDPPAWGAPACDSFLVGTCHRLRRRPLADLSVEDLRIMIGQGVGLRFLVPLAVEALERDPIVQGDLYPGDLFAAVLRLGPAFWDQHPEWERRIEALLLRTDVPDTLSDALATFRKRRGQPTTAARQLLGDGEAERRRDEGQRRSPRRRPRNSVPSGAPS